MPDYDSAGPSSKRGLRWGKPVSFWWYCDWCPAGSSDLLARLSMSRPDACILGVHGGSAPIPLPMVIADLQRCLRGKSA